MRSKNIKLVCSHCTNEFLKENRIYNVSIKKGQINFWCSKQCRDSFKRQSIYESVHCQKCNVMFERNKNVKPHKLQKFCSRHCGNSHIRTDESRKKISETMKNSNAAKAASVRRMKDINIIEKPCAICDKVFLVKTNRKRVATCGDRECRSKYISLQIKKSTNCGGYRPGSGIGKSGRINGIALDSTYEIAFYLEHRCDNIIRNTKRFPFKDSYYIPDFVINGEFYEIKGYTTEVVYEKLQAMRESGYIIHLIDKTVCIPLVEKYKKLYNVKCLSELYDNKEVDVD